MLICEMLLCGLRLFVIFFVLFNHKCKLIFLSDNTNYSCVSRKDTVDHLSRLSLHITAVAWVTFELQEGHVTLTIAQMQNIIATNFVSLQTILYPYDRESPSKTKKARANSYFQDFQQITIISTNNITK